MSSRTLHGKCLCGAVQGFGHGFLSPIDVDEDAAGQAKRLAPATHRTTTAVDAIMVQAIGS
jgi:hypothetical protein